MLVVDSSVIIEALATVDPPPRLIERLVVDDDLHAPYLIDTEVLAVLRRMVISDKISTERAEVARADFASFAVARYSHEPLSDRVWALRHNVSAYDATFVALAELLDAPLVTCDARLAATPGHSARIELFRVAN